MNGHKSKFLGGNTSYGLQETFRHKLNEPDREMGYLRYVMEKDLACLGKCSRARRISCVWTLWF